MKKTLGLVFILISMLFLANPSYADSPITSTDFYRAYLDEDIVNKAANSGTVDNEIAAYLSSVDNPIDRKAAVVNALGWNFDGKDNAEKYTNIVFGKSVQALNLEALSGDQLFVVGYLMAMDDYFDTSEASSILQRANTQMNDSLTVSLVNAIVYSQELPVDSWPEIWTSTYKVLQDNQLRKDLRPEAVKIIFDYMGLYDDGKTIETGQNETFDYFKRIRLIVGQVNADVNYEPKAMEQPAFVNSGRTLVPLRFLGEALGATVSWDSAKKQAKLVLGDREVVVTTNSKIAYINGKLTVLDVPAEIKQGRTFIPLRFVGEALGASVDYNPDTKTILVRYMDTSAW